MIPESDGPGAVEALARAYLVDARLEEERPDGSLVIHPPTYLEQLLAEDGSQPLSDAEFGSLVLPGIAPGDDEE